MKQEEQQKRDRFEALALLLIAFVSFSRLARLHNLFIYQGRDIHRATELLSGHWIWFGPELTGGGALPGPFYYWLIAAPLALFETWESLIWLNIGLASLAAVGFWYFGKKYFSNFTGLLLFFLFVNSRFVNLNLSYFWNPSYIFIFQALILLLLFEPQSKNKSRILGAGLILGLSLQIHFMQIVFLLGAVASLWLIPKVRLSTRLKETKFLILFTLLPLVPYFLWLGSNALKSTPVYSPTEGAKTLLNPLKLIADAGFGPAFGRFRGVYQVFYDNAIAWDVLLLLSAVIWIFVFVYSWRGRKIKVPFPKNKFLLATLVFSIPPLLSVGYSFYFNRYAVPFFIIYFAVSAPIIEWFESKYRIIFQAALTVGIAYIAAHTSEIFIQTPPLENPFDFSLFVFIVAGAGLMFLHRKDGARLVTLGLLTVLTLYSAEVTRRQTGLGAKNLENRKLLSETIINSTGWNYDYFREHAYIIGIAPDDDISAPFEQIYRTTKLPPTRPDFDGVLIVKGIVLSDDTPKEFQDAFREKELECVKLERANEFHICYYKFKDRKKYFNQWNNLGSPYGPRQAELFGTRDLMGFHKIDRNSGVFYFNVCSNFAPVCRVYFKVGIVPGEILSLHALGDPISVPDPAPNPEGAAYFEHLEIEYSCGQQNHSVQVVSHLGFPDRMRVYPGTFYLAPFEKIIPVKCKNISEVILKAGGGMRTFNSFNAEPIAPWELHWPVGKDSL